MDRHVFCVHAIQSIHAIAQINELLDHRPACSGTDHYFIATAIAFVGLDEDVFPIFDAWKHAVACNLQAVSVRIVAVDIQVAVTMSRRKIQRFEVTFISQLRIPYDGDSPIFCSSCSMVVLGSF
ncbi:hypothetical protein D3C81_1718090 [compost metagenome]